MDTTLLISTFNRAPLLDRSLARLAQLTVPDEVLVVDDGSTDETAEVCDRHADLLPLTYIYNHNPEWSICSMARNIGVKNAANEWIITSEPELFFVTDVVKQFEYLQPEHPEQVISAGTIYFQPEGGPDPSTNVEGLEVAGDYTPPTGMEEAIGWVAPFSALYNRNWLEHVGGWDEEFPGPWGWDDIDLLTRLRIKGINQHIALDVKALHQWHGPKHRGDVDFQNEQYFRAKDFVAGGVESPDLPDLIANQDREWGVIVPR
jgi:glycosyltransferase involved in cell wall biosynthesis